MNKTLKTLLIIICILIGIIVIDTIQAKIFNNSPIIKIRENYDGGTIDYKDIGIFVTTYKFNNGEKKTVFRGQNYTYTPTESNINNENIDTDTDIDIDNFYAEEITKQYTDIRNLPEDYDLESAIEDNCFVISGAKVYHDNQYEEFMTDYQNSQSAFIRIAQPTVEGYTIIYDLMYDEDTDKIYLITDYTRDEFSVENDRVIELNEYDDVVEYQYGSSLYWVAYSGELNDDTFNSDNVFILALVN